MKVASLIISLFFISFSILIFIMSIELGIGSVNAPGPGFLGFLSSICLFVLSSAIFFLDRKKSDEDYKEDRFTRKNLVKPGYLAASLVGFTLILDILGFLVSSFLLLWTILLISTPKKWFRQMVNALIIVNVTYFVLCKLLGVILPSGLFNLKW